ncbi:DUF4240 domain-containing protein [Terrabacter sp. GCM10028922]|uniref:DUF4240 domain-containing protein n=1 Tax=Terrabacter sp. GCM10028922 TaxID=3273428 RepID=UPI003613BA6D
MHAPRGALPLLVAAALTLTTASCGNPSSPGVGSTPVDSIEGTGWFSYQPPPGATPVTTDPIATMPGARAMTSDQFWAIVDRVASRDPEGAAESLTSALEALGPEGVLAYEAQFVEQMKRSNTYLHLAAAEAVMGFTSEDVFVSFRTWVLYQGRVVYDAFVSDPDSLAAHGPDDDEQVGAAEELEFTPLDVWSELTGRDPDDEDSDVPDHGAIYEEPSGTPVDASRLASRFPRLTAAYAGGSPESPAPITRR